MPIVLSNDAAWGGWGWAVCTEDGPQWAGHVVLAGRAWRYAALRAYLAQLELELGEAHLLRRPSDGPVRVVVERCPAVYSRGNQAATGWGLGTLAGSILLWGARPALAYPWDVPVRTWRSWWWPKVGNRKEAKRLAIRTVVDHGWGRHLASRSDPTAADVAEAILLGVGAARHGSEAPKGPSEWSQGEIFDLHSGAGVATV